MADIRTDLETVWRSTQTVYERQAKGWDAHRAKVFFEKDWLDRFLENVSPGGHLLDLGCGAGDPIAAYFLEKGFRVTGIDYARSMIAMARARYPQGNWQVQDMRSLALDGLFDGAISWDGSFHLSRDEQRRLISDLGRLVLPGAPVMLTIGPEDGETVGMVEGETVYHASLSPAEYRSAFDRAGFDIVDLVTDDTECDMHSVILAVKRASERAAAQ